MDDVTGPGDHAADGPVASGKITGSAEPAVVRPVVPVDDLPPPPDDPSRN